MIPNLNMGTLNKLIKRIEALERANPLSNSSLGRGQMRFYNGSVLLIENGALRVTGSATISGLLDVTGTATISGILNVSGQTTLSGTTTIAGPTGVTGKLTIQGDTSITGKLDIEGNTTLTGNMDVVGGGKITVGNTILSPSASNGGVEFASGGGVGGNGGSVVMRGSANAGFLASADTASAMFAGPTQLNLSGGGIQMINVPVAPVGNPANVYIDPAGKVWRANP